MPGVWGLGQQDPRDAQGHAVQLEMETQEMPDMRDDLRDVRDTGRERDATRADQPRREAREVTLQDAINKWTNRERLWGFDDRLKNIPD